jgi:uncharacterized membrane protein
MVLWGLLIVALLLAALLLPWGVGVLLVGPWLGHATWHAYCEAIYWPPRPEDDMPAAVTGAS